MGQERNGHWICLFLLLTYLACCCASHFRGAVITWKPGTSQRAIVVEYRISWRKSYGSTFFCDANTVQSGALIGQGGSNGQFKCLKYCSGLSSPLPYQCTDFSEIDDWSSGRGSKQVTFANTQNGYFELGFTGDAWISLNSGGGGSWMLRMHVDITRRSDTHKINSSPTVDIAPIIRAQYGCNHTIKLPVHDVDGDIVRCRWAGSGECGSVCNSFPGAYLYNDTCTILFNATRTLGWYAAAVQVEDYRDINATSTLSSVPVQFLVNVYQSTDSCFNKSEFMAPTPLDNACYGVPRGDVFRADIVVRVSNENRSISEIKTTSPLGMAKSNVINISATDWKINVTWTPQDYATVNNVFCFTAVESGSRSESEQRCITLLAGVDPPDFVRESRSPKDHIRPDNTHWNITVDKAFTLTSRQRFIHVYDVSGNPVESLYVTHTNKITTDSDGRTLSFTTTKRFIEMQQYYILFDYGVVMGTDYCNPGSAPISDTYYWRFTIRDVTPPVLTMLNVSLVTNATTHLRWQVNEPVTSVCTLTYPNGTTETAVKECNGSWTGTELTEGRYRMDILPTDLAGNVGLITKVQWNVDTTPPHVTFTRTPRRVSKQQDVNFRWTPSEQCTTKCRFHDVDTTVTPWSECSSPFAIHLDSSHDGKTIVFQVQATDTVENTGSIMEYKWTADFTAPTISFCGGGEQLSVSCTRDLRPEMICNATANDNVDKLIHLSYKDDNSNYCGLTRTWTTTDTAGNTATKSQAINIIVDHKAFTILRRPGDISVACGALNEGNMTDILARMFEINHQCNLPVHYKFLDNRNSDLCDVTIHRVWTVYDDCNTEINVTQIIKVRHVQNPLSPENGQTGTSLNVYLHWRPSGQGTTYQIFIWEYGLPRPVLPKITTTSTVYTSSQLKPATKYLWQIVFNLSSNETFLGPLWGFETRKYVDMLVKHIQIPPTAFSGKSYEVKWTVTNIGSTSTQQRLWYDAVYISWTDSFANSKLQSYVRQRNVILPGDGYSSVGTIKFDEGQIGNAYVFVETNYWNYLDEMNRTNNILRSQSTIDVQLTPPPDLVISAIRVPTTTFSGKTIEIRWTVVNNGEGKVANGRWTDAVWWSADKVKDFRDTRLTTFSKQGTMDQRENYTVARTVNVPEFISGDFYILVETDVYNQVFEYTNDGNNFQISQPIHVVLTPPPDLSITALHVSEHHTTGDTLFVSWNVTNVGDAVPVSQRYWIDQVIMESTTTQWVRHIGHQSHYGILQPNKLYTASISYFISPDIPTGTYSIIVSANYNNRLFELNPTENNKRMSKIVITRAVPNLQVQSFAISTFVENTSNVIQAYWLVKNIGHATTFSDNWVDSIYVRIGDNYYNTFALTHSVITVTGGLKKESEYEHNETIVLPQQVYGEVTVILNVDDMYSSSGDDDMTDNKKLIPSIYVPLKAADFSVMSNVSVKGSIIGGQQLSVKYTVINTGISVRNEWKWADNVLITKHQYCNYARDNALTATHIIRQAFSTNTTYTKIVIFNIPEEMSGTYLLCISANIRNDIFEGPNTENNNYHKEIYIESAPTADLSVEYVQGNISGETGKQKLLKVEWKVKNVGNSMKLIKNGYDSVGLSRTRDMSGFKSLNSFYTEYILEANGIYKRKKTVVIPASITGDIYICVFADSSAVVRESHSKQNNFVCTETVLKIKKPSEAALSNVIESVKPVIPNQNFPGSDIIITFLVTNIGELTTKESSWVDSIYVTDSHPTSLQELLKMGYNVANIIHFGALKANGTYKTIETFTLPNTLVGSLSFYVFPNMTENRKDEYLFDGTSITDPIPIPSAINGNISGVFPFQMTDKLPNLQVEVNGSLSNLVGGQPLSIEYNILNDGEIRTIQSWYDAVYLSDDYLLDVFDTKLKSVLRKSNIEVNETLVFNISVTLPFDLETKSYYLILDCDSKNDINEVNEDDNQKPIVFDMQMRTSTDIMVTNVIAQNRALYSDTLNIRWDVINNGSSLAEGYKCDTAYLSEDADWDIDDAPVGKPKCSHFYLNPNDTAKPLHLSVTGTTPLITPMAYNTIVKTRTNLLDMNLYNNAAVAKNKTIVEIERLIIDQKTTKSLFQNEVFALHIVNVPIDQTLIVSVVSDYSDSFNRVFIKGGSPATLFDFDISSDNPNQANNSLSITSTTNQNYYVLIANTESDVSEPSQKVTVLAKIAKFEIIDLFPKSVIKDATVTLRITGALFNSDMKAHLSSNTEHISAEAIYVFTSTDAYATFNIPKTINSSTFTFSFTSNIQNKTVEFSDEIHIINGTKGYLTTYISKPGALLFGEKGYITINLNNAGDSDIYVPLVFIRATGDGEIKLMDATKSHLYAQEYFVFGSTSKGPAGILPPKAMSVIQFETREIRHEIMRRVRMNLDVAFLEPSRDKPNPFMKQMETLKPSHYDQRSWESIWNNFVLTVGTDSYSLIRKLSKVLTKMSVAGRRVTNVNDIIQYLIDVADAPYAVKNLVMNADIMLESGSAVELVVVRYLSSRIGSRRQHGSMGNGWILPLWDTNITNVDNQSLTLSLDKQHVVFILFDNKKYINMEIGVIEHEQDYKLRRYGDNKEYVFDAETLKLKSVVSLVDDSNLQLVYVNNKLTKIKHSNGPYVSVTYDLKGRIKIMEAKNTSSSREIIKSFYAYDLEVGMLKQAVVGGKETNYVYNYDYSIRNVINSDKSMFVYEYSNMGHVAARRYSVDYRYVSGLEYRYDHEALVTVTTQPNNVESNITFGENGETILVKRAGYLPAKTVRTKSTEINYEGDSVVLERRYYNSGKHIQLVDGSEDTVDTYFNDLGQLVQFNDGGGNEYHVFINKNGSLNHIQFPDDTNKSYAYSENSHLITTQNGVTKKFEYNSKRQLVKKDIGNNSVSFFEYNENGKMTKAVNEHSNIEFKYENYIPVGVSYEEEKLEYTYNDDGLLSSIKTENNYHVRYLYNDVGNVIEVLNEKTNKSLLKATYNQRGKIVTKTLGNNATVDHEYDTITNLLTKITNKFPNGSIASYFKYRYSKRHRRISMETNEGKWEFTYDASGQILTMTSPDKVLTKYSYDNRKNRKTVSINDVEVVVDINNMNQYSKYGPMELKYDKNGNLIEKTNSSISKTFAFNEDNKLTEFLANGERCLFTYDALGNIYTKTCNGTKIRYVVNPFGIYGANIIQQVTEKNNNNDRISFYYGGVQIGLIAMDDGTDMKYFLFDPVGSVVGILGDNGDLLNSYQSDPFGTVMKASETVYSPFTFVGQWGVMRFHEIPEMYLMRSRLYDSSIGRFISIDTYGLKAKSKNFYVYCFNNPVHFNDPEGTCPVCFAIGFGALESGFNYYMDHRDGSFTWGGAAGALAHGAVDGALSSVKTLVTAASAIKNGVDYAYEHRNGGYTVKGQAIALARGAFDGYVSTLHLSPGEKIIVGASADVIQNFVENPNGFKEQIGDFTKGAAHGVEDYLLDKINTLVNKDGDSAVVSNAKKLIGMAIKRGLDGIEHAVENGIQTALDWVVSHDPNDLIGPPGHGAARFVGIGDTLKYKIRFENDENATAPAQRVYIKYKYSEHLDPKSFAIGQFGFGNLTRAIPIGSKHFQVSINMTAELGVYVRAVAGIDLTEHMVFWEFQSVDPNTGEAPSDPTIGFLPPNNGTSGQGFVTFSMKPKPNVLHLTTIHTNASIYFDENEPIDTPDVFNTIDASDPASNISEVPATRSPGSVTVALNSSDSGSGVKHVDLFLLQENGFALFKAGITESIFVIPLEKGNAYQLLPVAVDYVGNRLSLEHINEESILKVEYFAPTDNICDCSGHGNCTLTTELCVCDNGYYGVSCNQTERPIEPPVLELRSSSGVSLEPIELYISARNVSGPVESLTINVNGFPKGTQFSEGNITDNNTLVLEYSDFGAINMTTLDTYSGNLTLKIAVIQTSQTGTVSRLGSLMVIVYPDISQVSIDVRGCFVKVDNETVVDLNATVKFGNMTSSVPFVLTLALPEWASINTGSYSGDGVYTFTEDMSQHYYIHLNEHFEQIYVNVSVLIEQKANGIGKTIKRAYEISHLCEGDCNGGMYGINCDMECPCKKHRSSCSQFDGSCTCLAGWTGDICTDDVDECAHNDTLCNNEELRICLNTPGNYSCVCQDGYADYNDTCTECDGFYYGFNCSFPCKCADQHAVSCNHVNGTCTCTDEWKGTSCDTDVNECALNKSICEEKINTDCQNNIGGFDCPCLLGFHLINESCIEIPHLETTTSSQQNGLSNEKITNVEIHIDITIPSTDNIRTAVTFEKYKHEATIVLSEYYRNFLGIGFLRVEILSLRSGSLVVDHNVITRNTEYVAQELVVAVHDLSKDTNLQFFGENVTIKEVMVEHTKVNNSDQNQESNLCVSFAAISPCDKKSSCVLVDNIPTCRVTSNGEESNAWSYTELALAISLSVSVLVLIIVIVVFVMLHRKNKRNRKYDSGNDNSEDITHSSNRNTQHPNTPNRGFDDVNNDRASQSSFNTPVYVESSSSARGENPRGSSRYTEYSQVRRQPPGQTYRNPAYSDTSVNDDANSDAGQSNWRFRPKEDFSFKSRARTRANYNEYS